MDLQHLIGAAVIAFVLWTVLTSRSQPPPTIAGKQVVHENTTVFNGWKRPTDGEAEYVAADRTTGRVLAQYVADGDGLLHETAEQREHGSVILTETPQEYVGRWQLDAGALLAVNRTSSDPITPGIRLSPARILYGTCSPDLVITDRSLGIGLSCYPPRRTGWSHYGIGLWYLHAVRDGGADGLALGVATTFR